MALSPHVRANLSAPLLIDDDMPLKRGRVRKRDPKERGSHSSDAGDDQALPGEACAKAAKG